MRKLSRRELLQQAGAFATAVSAGPGLWEASVPQQARASSDFSAVISLNGKWLFRLDPEGMGESQSWHLAGTSLEGWTEATVPHTWQISPGSAEYQGIAWYRRPFEAPATWADKTIRIEFEAISHSATVWLNGKLAGRHLRRGYTAFYLDVSSALKLGADNLLVVNADNSFDPGMLPHGKSFDWTVDRGIIRPIRLLVTPQTFLGRVDVDAQPDLETNQAHLQIRVVVQNASRETRRVKVSCRVAEDDTGRTVLQSDVMRPTPFCAAAAYWKP